MKTFACLNNMAKVVEISFILFVLVGLSAQAASNESSMYKAGVVEYAPSMNIDTSKRITENVDRYLKFIQDAKKQDVDIVVFPESTLNSASGNRVEAAKTTTNVPAPSEHEVPCHELNSVYQRAGKYTEILGRLSCAAKQLKIYVVVNLAEQEACTAANDDRPCASDGLNFYNTDVVFDRKGEVVARYRKFNLFGERHMNTTRTAEHSTFDTDFGVRFGLFTCFDILFNEPTLALVREGVRDFIFPTMWFSELPFLTALQIQEYWSYTNDVNLLASGASNTLIGSGGSGIYAGTRGPLTSFISYPGGGQQNTRLLIATVPKLKGGHHTHNMGVSMQYLDDKEDYPNMDAFRMKRDEIDHYTSQVIGERFSKELCSGSLCCKFDVTSQLLNKTEGKNSYQYRAIVGDIVRSFTGAANGGIKSCGIIACSGSDYKKCAVRFNKSSDVAPRQVFHSIHIQGNFPAIEEVLTMPNTLSHHMRPLPAGSFLYDEVRRDGGVKRVSMSLRGLPVDNLQTFAIFGRDFRGDDERL